ncbi:hypothetical protein [Streptomyces sp. NPDC017260]|uniref:hypothetical protein n=1 Tax=unclassified Streptomyces TaxID=2593676 RepID=UPI00378C1FEF
MSAVLRAEVDRLSAELANLTPKGPRAYRSWLFLSTAERAAEVRESAERNRVERELRGAEDRLAEYERMRALLAPGAFLTWTRARYGCKAA